MKKSGFLLIIAIAFFLNANAQTHFTPTGDFTNAMNFKVLIATVNDVGLEPGDEIAIFDGTLCVGTAVLTEDLGEEFDLKILYVNAGADDLGTPKQDGYRVGYTILYKIWDASEQTEINVVLSAYFDPLTGESIPAPKFERDGGAFVSLESTFSFFQITVQTEDCVCNGGIGSASFTINAGGTPLTGNVYDVFYKEQSQGQISSLTKTLPAGLHTFIIEDANKSRKFLDIPIMEPEPISFQVEQSLFSCGFDNSSVIISSASGGSGEYQQWEIARDTGFTQIEQTIPSVSDSSLNLKPGIYYIRLFDSNGCTGNYIDNQGIKIVIVNRLFINYNEPVCNGDMVEVSVVAEYENDGHLISYTCDDGLNWQASPVFNVQSGKSYRFGYRDETYGCTKSVDSFIVAPDPVVAENIFTVDATCYGAENGKIAIKKIKGGNGPEWNISVSGFDYKNDTVNLSFTGISDTNAILTGIPASSGNYIILINDSKGCSSEAYSVEINQPLALDFQVQAYNSTGNSCSEGRITVQDISGGTPFSGLYEVWLNNKLVGKFQNYDSGSTLYPGSYLVAVTDSMGCSLTQSVTIGSDITPVTIACPADTSISNCLSEIEIDSMLNLWVEKTTVTLEGGCNPSVTVQINKGDLFCGGNAYVSWMMYDEGILRDSCEAVFNVESPDTLLYNFPADTLMQTCDILTNLDLKNAFENWVINTQNDIEHSISGGCNPGVEILTEFPEYPDICTDWIKTVEWLVTDRCDTAILSAQFKLIAPENVTHIALRDTVLTVCNFHKNYSAQEGFESWVNQLTVEIETSINGGCNPVVTNNSEQFRINDDCGQQQIKVTWFITDKCFTDSTSATFFLMAPEIIKFDSPVDTTLMSCAIQSENEIENLFNGWVQMQTYVIQSTISGGCVPVVIVNQDSVLLNDKCNSWSKQVEWLVTDKCDTISVKHNFNFIGSDEISFLPPTDTLINSCEFAGKEQVQQLFSQWVKQKESELKKSITGGCYPVVSGNAESVVIPDVCINWQVEVRWIIADKCDSVVTSAFFKMEA
ncbi:MAG: hypothetical protein JXR31_14560, partial [Prolixibacteraceae bacterium]|nr:hypothetical protein [Prolixibacteraceae bacterium]